MNNNIKYDRKNLALYPMKENIIPTPCLKFPNRPYYESPTLPLFLLCPPSYSFLLFPLLPTYMKKFRCL